MYSQVMFCAARFPLLTGDRALLEYLPRFRSLASAIWTRWPIYRNSISK